MKGTLWSLAEADIAICCASVPAIKPLFIRVFFFHSASTCQGKECVNHTCSGQHHSRSGTWGDKENPDVFELHPYVSTSELDDGSSQPDEQIRNDTPDKGRVSLGLPITRNIAYIVEAEGIDDEIQEQPRRPSTRPSVLEP